jgi:PPOX class probable F420-dependent enzyme
MKIVQDSGFPRVPASEMRPMTTQIPSAIRGQKYVSLTTFRKTGVGVPTPVWFGEEDGKLYVMTRGNMGKAKRIRNNPRVKLAPCTIRGKVTGPEFAATARVLPPEEHQRARQSINRKYWMARIPLVWARTDTYFEISFA